MPASDKVTRIARSRLMAGIALHFLAPAYLLWLLGDAAMGRAPGSWAGWLPHALGLGLPFLAVYGAASLGLIAAAAVSDRIGRRPQVDGQDGLTDLRQSLAVARGRLGGDIEVLLEKIAAMPLDHRDSQVREIARDIARLLDAEMAASHGHGAPQDASGARTMAALDTLIRALDDKSRESALLARDRVHTLANYVAAKYGEKID